jgi:hypothetical protein
LDEADDGFLKSPIIDGELGNRPNMALTCTALGLLSEARKQAALHWRETSAGSVRMYPGFARTVRIFGGQCALGAESYSGCGCGCGGEQRGGGLPGLGAGREAEVREFRLQQA